MDLWIGAIQVLNPVQTAVVLTSCRPFVPHLPDICNVLLSIGNTTTTSDTRNQPVIEGQGFSITDMKDS